MLLRDLTAAALPSRLVPRSRIRPAVDLKIWGGAAEWGFIKDTRS
jgi:hypothetical protein